MLSKGWLEEGSRHLDGDFPCARDATPLQIFALLPHSTAPTQPWCCWQGPFYSKHSLPPPPNPLFHSIGSCCSAKQTKRRTSRHVTFPGSSTFSQLSKRDQTAKITEEEDLIKPAASYPWGCVPTPPLPLGNLAELPTINKQPLSLKPSSTHCPSQHKQQNTIWHH